MRAELARAAVAGPARTEPGQCRARCRRRGGLARDRHRHSRRRRAACPSSAYEQAEAAGPLVRGAARATNGPRSSCPRLISARSRRRRSSASRTRLPDGPARTIIDERLREREFGIFDRLTTLGHPRPLPGRGRAPPAARQILPPSARRRELGRRDPAAAVDAQHDQPPLLRQARPDRLPPGRGAVLPLHPRRARRAAILASTSRPTCSTAASPLMTSSPTRRACAFPSWRCGITARRSRQRARRRPPSPMP